MLSKDQIAAVALSMIAGAAAHADTALSVFASYDAYGTTQNTSITVTNTSGVTESNVDITSGSYSEMLGSLAPGASSTYSFNEASGPFVNEPGDKGLSDTTTYQVSAQYSGASISSNLFSPVSNLTGAYVDFLGACYLYETGCSIDPNSNFPESGVVAAAATPVPLPPSLAFLAGGLVLLGAKTRRRV